MKRRLPRSRAALRLATIAVVLAASAGPAAAATIVPTTTADDATTNGNCTLREAVLAANGDTAVDACTAGSGEDTIQLAPGEYWLSLLGAHEDASATGDLDLLGDVHIAGDPANVSVVNANSADRVFHVHPGVTVSFRDLLIRDGAVPAGGPTYDGGGILAQDAVVVLERCGVISNVSGYGGGGIASKGGNLTIRDSVLQENRCNWGTGGLGCGILFEGFGPTPSELLLERSSVAHNINAYGFGFAIAVQAWGDGDTVATIRNVTITHNDGTSPATSGGLYVVDNAGGGSGKALATLNNVTIYENSDVGVYAFANVPSDARIDVGNSIVSDNETYDCEGPVYSAGHNVVGDAVPPFQLTTRVCDFRSDVGDRVTSDAHLYIEYGDRSEEMMEVTSISPAWEAGSPLRPGSGGGACEATDQRGKPRYACDAGAWEALPEYCAEQALTTCRPASTGKFQLKDRDGDGPGDGDRITWKWSEPVETVLADILETYPSNYSLCVYDASGTQLLAALSDDGVLGCGIDRTEECWTTTSRGRRYRDTAGTRDGLTSISLTASEEPGSAKGRLKAGGDRLEFLGILPLVGDVRVQLQRSWQDICWETVHPASSVRRNTVLGYDSKVP